MLLLSLASYYSGYLGIVQAIFTVLTVGRVAVSAAGGIKRTSRKWSVHVITGMDAPFVYFNKNILKGLKRIPLKLQKSHENFNGSFCKKRTDKRR